MKRLTVFLVAVTTVAVFFIRWSNDPATADVRPRVQSLWDARINSLDSFLAAYPAYFYDSTHAVRQKKFEELSFFFKQCAGILYYTDPQVYLNKLLKPFLFEKSERPGLTGLIPDNFLLTGPVGNEVDSLLRKRLRSAKDTTLWVSYITQASGNYRKHIQAINAKINFGEMEMPQLFDMLRTELFRISAIDIGNGDIGIESAALPALNASVRTWLAMTNEFATSLPSMHNRVRSDWSTLYHGVTSYLDNNKDFIRFNRLFFLREKLIPLARMLNEIQDAMRIKRLPKSGAISNDLTHGYDKQVFNADYFAPDDNGKYSAVKARLGELLFFDPILSDNNKRSCASCHKPGMAYTDGATKSMAFDRQALARNSPTVINSGFQKSQFWDLRATSLEAQLDSVINNPDELHSSFENVIDRIQSSPEYLQLFRDAFGVARNDISSAHVKAAIGVYERTLVGLNSRFDKYMRGEDNMLNASEKNGFNLFMGKAHCNTCHFAPLFNGTFPPFYDVSFHHSLGVPVKDSMEKYELDPDKGAVRSTGDAFTTFSFKTPTLRNVGVTAPYMHNGVYAKLDQVVEFYNHGAGAKFSKDMRPDKHGVPFFTIIPFPLNLTPVEKKDLVAFLHTLTDTTAARKVPARLPRLEGKHAASNKRKIGGEY